MDIDKLVAVQIERRDAKAIKRQRDEAFELLRYQTYGEPHERRCDLDHHGYCQAHTGGFRTLDNGEPECWVKAALRLLGEQP